jgi:hypothetical protein
MFIPDATHTALFQAMSDLDKSRTALKSGQWAAKVLTMLLTSADVGALDSSIAFLKANADKINKIPGVCAEGSEAIEKANSALERARSKIPNTTPPDPRGFESCAAPSEPVDEWAFIPPT